MPRRRLVLPRRGTRVRSGTTSTWPARSPRVGTGSRQTIRTQQRHDDSSDHPHFWAPDPTPKRCHFNCDWPGFFRVWSEPTETKRRAMRARAGSLRGKLSVVVGLVFRRAGPPTIAEWTCPRRTRTASQEGRIRSAGSRCIGLERVCAWEVRSRRGDRRFVRRTSRRRCGQVVGLARRLRPQRRAIDLPRQQGRSYTGASGMSGVG